VEIGFDVPFVELKVSFVNFSGVLTSAVNFAGLKSHERKPVSGIFSIKRPWPTF
jgi:hypothetical protein